MPPKKTPLGRQSFRASRKRKKDIAASDELQTSLQSKESSPHRKKRFASPDVHMVPLSSPTPEEIGCVQNRSEDCLLVDSYCWVCHRKVLLERHSVCSVCPRVYHTDCLTKKNKFNECQACPECQLESVDGTSLPKSLTVEMLKKLLYALTLRVKKNIEDSNIINSKIFLQWPEELETNEIVHEMALDILQDKVNDNNHPYIKTSEFYSDVKWIYHNCCILYEGNPKQIAAAKHLMKDFKDELLDLEACPECYYHLFCEESDEPDRFVRICKTPHDIVWAKLKGSPHWPAKCLKVLDGHAHVRFFGEHERSRLKVNEMFHISECHPNKTGPPKTLKKYFEAMEELGLYIDKYKGRFRVFKFYPTRTRYVSEKFKPLKETQKEKTPVLTEKRASLVAISQMKSEVRAGCMQERNNSMAIQVDQDITIEVDPTPSDIIQVDPINSSQENEIIQSEELVIDPPCIDISDTSQKQMEQAPLRKTSQPTKGLVSMQYSKGEENVLTEISANPISEDFISSPVTTCNSSHPKQVADDTSVSSSPASTPVADCGDLSEEEMRNKLRMIQLEMMSFSSKQMSNSEGHSIFTPALLDPSSHGHPSILEGNNNSASLGSESEVAATCSTDINFTPNASCSESTSFDGGDDDVVVIDPPYSVSQRQHQRQCDPSLILPYILNQDQNMKSVFQDGRYVFDTLFVRLWALACRVRAPEAITRAQGEIKKLKAEIEERKLEEEKCLEDIAQHQEETDKLLSEIERLKQAVDEEHQKYMTQKKLRDEAAANANAIVASVQGSFNTKWSMHAAVLNRENEIILSEKNQIIDELENSVKQLHVKIDHLNKALEEAKSKTIIKNETLNVKMEKPESEIIKGYKRNDYCWVCLKPGKIRCCWNTNYCSEKCEKDHSKNHKKNCHSKVKAEAKRIPVEHAAIMHQESGAGQNANYVKIFSHNQMIQRTSVMQLDTVSSVITPPNPPNPPLYSPFSMPSTSGLP